MFQPMNKNLSHDFVNCVTKANRPEMACDFQTKLFWDEDNQGLIKMLKDFLCCKYFFDFKFHGLSHYQSKPLEEYDMKTIWPQSFKCFHGL